MKQYPTIPKEINKNIPVYVFNKLDGSNIRVEWNEKRGFYKFGSRKKLIDSQVKFLGEAITLVNKDFQYVDFWLKDRKIKQAVCYFEFYGANSFAGQHVEEEHFCALIDVEVHNKGFLSPDVLVSAFEGKVPTAKCLLKETVLDDDLVKVIVESTLSGVTLEGVVCKAKLSDKTFHNLMFKIKTTKWIEKVKSLYKDPTILDDLI